MLIVQLIIRNSYFFFNSAVRTAVISVIPQIFLLRYYPDQKHVFLSVFLLAGTVGSMLGIWASHPGGSNKNQYIGALWYQCTMLLIVVVLLFALFVVREFYIYAIINGFLQFFCCFFINQLDQYFVRHVRSENLRAHVQVGTLLRLAGVCIGPLYFSFYSDNLLVSITVFLCLSLLSLVGLQMFSRKVNLSISSQREVDQPAGSMSRQDRMFFVYCFSILAATFVFVSNFIFILTDIYQLHSAERMGGILIAVLNAVAIVGVLLSRRWIQKNKSARPQGMFPLRPQYAVTMISLLSFVFLALHLSVEIEYLLLLSVSAGMSYGVFVSLTRFYASASSQADNKPKMLTYYNNLDNVAYLFAFTGTALISLLQPLVGISYTWLIVANVLTYLLLAMLVLSKISKVRTREIVVAPD